MFALYYTLNLAKSNILILCSDENNDSIYKRLKFFLSIESIGCNQINVVSTKFLSRFNRAFKLIEVR